MLPALAATTDVSARYPGTLTADQTARLPTLLSDASTVVRGFTRQDFTVSTTTEAIRPIGDRVRLRQIPVTGVSAVGIVDTLDTGNLVTLPMGAWMWDGGQEIWIGSLVSVINLPDDLTELLAYQVPLIQVTYTHGYTTVPDPVVTVVCSMILRALDTPGPTSMASGTVGAISYRLSATATDGILGLTDTEMRLLGQYRREATTVELR